MRHAQGCIEHPSAESERAESSGIQKLAPGQIHGLAIFDSYNSYNLSFQLVRSHGSTVTQC